MLTAPDNNQIRTSNLTVMVPRYTLNFKGIPHRTEWVELPDVEALLERLDPRPKTGSRRVLDSDAPPVIFDPNTNTAFKGSAVIVRYLEVVYPRPSPLFSPETEVLHGVFDYGLTTLITKHMIRVVGQQANAQLNPPSRAFLQSEHALERMRMSLEMSPLRVGSEEYTKGWAALEAGLDRLAALYTHVRGGQELKVFVMGDRISHADFLIASWLVCAKRVFGPASEEWKTIASWNDGKWGKLLEALEQYEVVT